MNLQIFQEPEKHRRFSSSLSLFHTTTLIKYMYIVLYSGAIVGSAHQTLGTLVVSVVSESPSISPQEVSAVQQLSFSPVQTEMIK